MQTYNVNKFLGEYQELIGNHLSNHLNSLLVAPCGTGKTYTVINYYKNKNIKFILLVPNKSVVEQLEQEYKICGTKEKTINTILELKKPFIVACYESIKHIKNISFLKEYILIIDETHSLIQDFHYRDNTVIFKLMDKFRSCKFLTATPYNLIKNYDERIDFVTSKKINAEISLITPGIDSLTKNKKKLTKIKYKKLLDDIQKVKPFPTLLVFTSGIEDMEEITGLNVVHSGNRQGEAYESIINGILPQGLTVTTNLFNAGLSLYNEEEVNLIIDFKSYDVNKSSFTQLINRFRKSKKVNVMVIDRNTKQYKAKSESIKQWGLEIVKRLNENNSSVAKEKVFNNPFIDSIEFYKGEFILNENNLILVEHKLNGYKNGSLEILEKISKENNWDFKGTLELSDIKEKTKNSKELFQEKKPKFILKNILLEDNEIKLFTYEYFDHRLKKNPYSKKFLFQRFKKDYIDLENAKSENKKIIDIIDKSILSKLNKDSDKTDIKKVLIDYFKLESKFNILELKEQTIQELKGNILKLEVDSKYFSKARIIIAKHIENFNPKRTITKDADVRSLIKFIGIKIKQIRGETNLNYL